MDNNKVKKNNLFLKRFFHHLSNNIEDGLNLLYWPLILTGLMISVVSALAGEMLPTIIFVVILLLVKTFLDMKKDNY